MRIEEYPPQEPPSEVSRLLHSKVMSLAEGIEGEEVVYGTVDPSQSMLIYPAERPNGRALLFLHGGGWTNGYKEEMAFLAPPLNARGFTFISASYRLAPRNIFPVNRDDVADAVAVCYQLASRFGYERDCLFIGGHSAGGHLASHLAVTRGWQEQRSLPLNVLKGCLPISGVYDFTPGCGLNMRPRFLGNAVADSEVLASPVFQLETLCTPFLVSYGSQDFPHLIMQARKFEMVLRAKGGAVRSLEIADVDHVSILLAAAQTDQPWLDQASAWMESLTPNGVTPIENRFVAET